MITWILVLTLSAPSANGGSSIAVLPDFKNESECLTAGRGWLATLNKGWAVPSVACVRQEKKE